MSPEKQQEIFEDRYASKLGLTYAEWLETAPKTEDQAYDKLKEIDDELKQIVEILSTQPDDIEAIEEERDRLKLEYDLIEEMFGLELQDR